MKLSKVYFIGFCLLFFSCQEKNKVGSFTEKEYLDKEMLIFFDAKYSKMEIDNLAKKIVESNSKNHPIKFISISENLLLMTSETSLTGIKGIPKDFITSNNFRVKIDQGLFSICDPCPPRPRIPEIWYFGFGSKNKFRTLYGSYNVQMKGVNCKDCNCCPKFNMIKYVSVGSNNVILFSEYIKSYLEFINSKDAKILVDPFKLPLKEEELLIYNYLKKISTVKEKLILEDLKISNAK